MNMRKLTLKQHIAFTRITLRSPFDETKIDVLRRNGVRTELALEVCIAVINP